MFIHAPELMHVAFLLLHCPCFLFPRRLFSFVLPFFAARSVSTKLPAREVEVARGCFLAQQGCEVRGYRACLTAEAE